MRASASIALAMVLVSAPIAAQTASTSAPVGIAGAIAATDRTPDNVKLDEGRKPLQLLQFFGLKSGMKVLDLFGANQYWAEIMAPAVGASGHVTVWQPTQFLKDERRKGFEQFAARQKNVNLISSPFEAPNLPPNSFDFAIMNLDYHDVYWEDAERKIVRMDPDAWLKTLYAAMKPGSVVGVVDHVASPGGDVRAVVDKLHRIDPEVVKRDFAKAGFKLEASSDMLRNPADDHSLLVFDPTIRGKTDRFILKFKKPS
jgi:predicted methyltransferase